KKEMRRLQKLIQKLETIRSEAINQAQEISLQFGEKVCDVATTHLIRELELEKRRRHFKEKLTRRQIDNILNYQPIEGQSIRQWFDQLKKSDLNRITQSVQKASVETLSLQEITQLIRGTKANRYQDGILETTRKSAQTLARTIINGVSNNARMETFIANADVLDGVRFVATLDGKTCPFCGSLDGSIWTPKELGNVRRPPLHCNCRCCLVPYLAVRDEEGNLIEVGERPAANEDFDKLAEEKYNKQAKENGWKRRYSNLAASTRLKYYYQAQKDYEARTGQSAYRQVPGSTNFKKYFEKQPESFQRSWLGAKRFEAYNQGKLKLDQLVKPDTGYFVPINELGLKVNAPLVHSGSNLTSQQINENMAREAENVFYELGKTGRKLGSGEKREKHFEVQERSFTRQGEPNSSVDFIKQNDLKKRRFYDQDGNADWEIDYQHQDSRGTHEFPHIHVWFGTERSLPIKYRKGKDKNDDLEY
ncbi:MAG: minor capsid protein, partial [Planctomycetia bacterium]|nr:minor capsid protein [Planctomycetia bacterium]